MADNDETKSEEEIDVSPRNEARIAVMDEIADKRRQEFEAEAAEGAAEEAAAEDDADARENAVKEAEQQDQAARGGAPAGQGGGAAIPEYESRLFTGDDGRLYLNTEQGAIPYDAAVAAFHRDGDSTRRYQEAASMAEQAQQYMREAEQMRTTQPKITKEQQEELERELMTNRSEWRDALVEQDHERMDELDRAYNAKMLEHASMQSAPPIDRATVLGYVQEGLNQTKQQEQNAALGEAFNWYKGTYPQIANSEWDGLVADLLERNRVAHPDWTPRQLFEESAKDVSDRMEALDKARSGTRQSRKDNAAGAGARGSSVTRNAPTAHSAAASGMGAGGTVTEAEINEERRKAALEATEARGRQMTGNVRTAGVDNQPENPRGR